MAFRMKYKKNGFPFKSSPMKIAPALIAQLAPMVLNAVGSMGGKGGGEKEKADDQQPEKEKKKIVGLN